MSGVKTKLRQIKYKMKHDFLTVENVVLAIAIILCFIWTFQSSKLDFSVKFFRAESPNFVPVMKRMIVLSNRIDECFPFFPMFYLPLIL